MLALKINFSRCSLSLQLPDNSYPASLLLFTHRKRHFTIFHISMGNNATKANLSSLNIITHRNSPVYTWRRNSRVKWNFTKGFSRYTIGQITIYNIRKAQSSKAYIYIYTVYKCVCIEAYIAVISPFHKRAFLILTFYTL